MKLYYAPWACSLADHIALLEVGENVEIERVDIHSKRTESGKDFLKISPKGYVPALVLDSGEMLTENDAILDWIADQHPVLRPAGPLGRTRLIEMLTFFSTEIHKAYKPLWHDGPAEEKQKARETIANLLKFTARQMQGSYLFGEKLSVADCYLFVMLRWAERFGIVVPPVLLRLQWRMEERPAVQAAIAQEEHGLHDRIPVVPHDVRENRDEHRFERPIHEDAIAAAYYRNADGNGHGFGTPTS